ncbi:MAG: hypothetical protein ACM34K_03905 [Bacillota bacterium]
MLDRIINIRTELDLNGKGYTGPDGRTRSRFQSKIALGDKISFSPAVHYLSRINWQLKQIVSNQKDKIKLTFLVSDFEFHAEIDLLKFNSEDRQLFDIIKDFDLPERNEKIILTVSVAKKDYSFRDDIQVIELNALRSLFERIVFLEVQGEINKYDSKALNRLMDEISLNIIKEFEYINTAFFTLVEKLIPGNNLQGLKFNAQTEPVTIEKIKALTNG